MIWLALQAPLLTLIASMLWIGAFTGLGIWALWASLGFGALAALAWLGFILYAPLPTPIARATGRSR